MNAKHLLAGGLLALATLAAQADVVYGSNLIVDGDAEGPLTAWHTFDGYSLFQHVEYGNNWVKPTEPGPVDRGINLFAGLGAYSAGYQLVDLGGALAQPLSYRLSGWLGGWAAQGDNALLYVSFLDSTDTEIGHAMIGPVMPADRNNATGLLFLESVDWLPAGTGKLMFSLSMERQGGGDNDGYADNLAFVLSAPTSVPEPSVAALLSLAAAALVLTRRHSGRRSKAHSA